MACACYVIILQRILHWFVQGKADDSPVSDLLPANLHLLYHLWKPLNVDFTYKQMFFCILFHLLWLFLPTFCRPGYLFVWSWQAGEDPCPLLLLLPARSPYAVLGPWFLRAFPAWWLSFESICCHIHTFLYIWRRYHTSWLQNHLYWICAYWNPLWLISQSMPARRNRSPCDELHLMEVLTGSAMRCFRVFTYI